MQETKKDYEFRKKISEVSSKIQKSDKMCMNDKLKVFTYLRANVYMYFSPSYAFSVLYSTKDYGAG